MRTHLSILIATGLIATDVSLAPPALAETAEPITSGTVETVERPVDSTAALDTRVAIERFVEHINYARVAVAMNHAPLAKEHIEHAQTLLNAIKAANTEMRRVMKVESGRVTYEYETDDKYHYFPIEAGPVEIKTVKKGPFWAKKGLAVTDAEVVYLTLNLTNDKADDRLAAAKAALDENKMKEADKELSSLTAEVVSVSEEVALPIDKARDNLSLARTFLMTENYEGARYALMHAERALKGISKSESHKDDEEVVAMRAELKELEEAVKKKNPALVEEE